MGVEELSSSTANHVLLRDNPCLHGCVYCNETLDVKKGLKQFFGYDSYKTFDGEPLQEEAAKPQ